MLLSHVLRHSYLGTVLKQYLKWGLSHHVRIDVIDSEVWWIWHILCATKDIGVLCKLCLLAWCLFRIKGNETLFWNFETLHANIYGTYTRSAMGQCTRSKGNHNLSLRALPRSLSVHPLSSTVYWSLTVDLPRLPFYLAPSRFGDTLVLCNVFNRGIQFAVTYRSP